ncbi:rhodanese-like domain-containing protein [Stutzerimonas nitrititolerans]|uniref:rhodanese-like domain-containing protein n=1 Tax=Stutzerimonas nitrititolerans TaxID=2482751 RepID=UPI001BDCFB72|nr:rhodanese-like domain-containing protein [Stutzerimonas nitrititolerans]MBT1121102.1 rhodanese-like domain-containing protein [Stutzerimonas nitrititolerans]WAD27918.1 rhodanese-like domain-containing protein [Pseudomonadaceae bacterium T75]
MLRMLALFCLLIGPLGAWAEEAPLEVPGAMTINTYQAKRLYDLGAVFVDVRPSREWAWGHIEGALHLDLERGFTGLALDEWPRTVPLVVYCDSEVCPSGAEAVRRAVSWGYQQVFYFRQGYFAWMLADLPLSKGEVRGFATLNAQAH